MAPKTHYDILGVSHDAPLSIIRNAFSGRMMSIQMDHLLYDEPSRESEDEKEARIVEVQEALEVLANPETRRQYDQHLRELANPTNTKHSFCQQRCTLPRGAELHYRHSLYPDDWIAARDRRVRSDGTVWTDPADRGSGHSWALKRRSATGRFISGSDREYAL